MEGKSTKRQRKKERWKEVQEWIPSWMTREWRISRKTGVMIMTIKCIRKIKEVKNGKYLPDAPVRMAAVTLW